MSTEESLRPRFKVVAPYPFSPYEVGDIVPFNAQDYATLIHDGEHCVDAPMAAFKSFPNLFCLMPWYEERQPEDMPAFLRNGAYGYIFKVQEYRPCNKFYAEGNITGYPWDLINWLPATQDEYTAYINSKQPQ